MIKAPKGTKDITFENIENWHFMEDEARKVFGNSNYTELRTPIFESTELFARGVGDSTDIVNKEMYTFIQKERSLTLRPENTAGVVRAFIENGMHRQPSPVKLWYKGPMFRYERPQAGRQRQFHQMGVEVFGIEKPTADAEVILAAIQYLEALGLPDLSLEINSLGCSKCRHTLRDNLKVVFKPKLEELCADCNVRYEKNPLRILDCKNPKCREIIEQKEVQDVINSEYICQECVEHFDTLKSYLDELDIKYSVNKLLVRGLDYYNRTVFEITSNSLGSQNAVCGGGRYDGLVEMLGGVATPAVGWAMGMERLNSLIEKKESTPLKAFVVSNLSKETLSLVKMLRAQNIAVDFDLGNKKFKKQLEKASKLKVKYALILGEDELSQNKITLKNMSDGTQEMVSKEELIEKITL